MQLTDGTFNLLLNPPNEKHIAVLYDSKEKLNPAIADYINEGLRRGQYCVYATVDANDKDFASKLAPRIANYDRHVQEGNFVLVNFRPFYDSAANGQLTPFNQLKAEVELTLKNRIASGKSAKALLVADAACNLARHKQFDECVTLEGWWQDTYGEWMAKNLDITIICAHPSSVLKQQSMLGEQSRISHVHSLTLDLNDFKGAPAKAVTRPLRILVAEPDADIRLLYERYLNSLPVELVAVPTGNECLEQIAKNNREGYDLVIIDTHIRDANGLEIAKKILRENEGQDIAITSTWDMGEISSSLQAHSIDPERYPILHKPFRFSQLLGIVQPSKIRLNN